MKTSLLFLLVFNVGFINVLGAGNILFVDPVLAPSHQMWNSHIVRALLKIGYNVTLIGTKTVPLIEHKNLTFFELKVRDEKMDPFLDPQELQETGMFASMYLYYDYGTVECEESLISPDLKRLIDYPKDFKFDAIVYDVSVDKCLYFLIQRFNFPPTIGTQPFLLVPSTSEAFGNVVSPSYLPNMYSKYNDVMSFPQRVMNWIGSLYDRILLKQYYEPLWYEKSKQFFGPDTIKTSIIERHFCILLCNIIQGFHYPRPVTPNIIPVGGLHIKPAKKLPEDLEEIFNKSEHGVILFSFGSIVRTETMDPQRINTLLDALGRLKQTVLLKMNQDLPNLPKNVITRKWFPQSDILGHPKTILFISHCGGLSTMETMYHGVPIIGIPFFLDQHSLSSQLHKQKLGIKLDFNSVTSEQLYNAIQEIINNPIYTENVKKISAVVRDQPQLPLDRAIFWIEWAIRNNGSQLLGPRARDLSLFVSSSLDVYLFILLLFVFLTFILKKLIGIVIGCLKGSENSIKQNKKKTN